MGRRKPSTRREPLFDIAPGGDSAARSRTKTKRSTRRRGSRKRSRFGRIVYWGAVLGVWLMLFGIGTLVWVGANLPPIQSLEIPKRPPSIEIVGLDRTVLATRGEMGGETVPVRQLPPYVPKAFIAIEDRRFPYHFGFDPIGLARAAATNLLNLGVTQGGSTITQQLAKNLFLTPERTFKRKLQELVLALWLEAKFSKREILTLYLNRIYFGAGAYGIEAAAQRYFGKTARQLTLAEGAMLAGIVRAPSRLAPTRNPSGAERRARVVLAAMVETGAITAAMARSAKRHPAHAVKPAGAGSVNYVADWIMDVLDDLVGRVEQDVVVETTIDPRLQTAAENALVGGLDKKGKKFRVGQGALVAMTPDGAVRAMVGGRNYAESQFNRAVAAKRQPGSAFKPFVYLTALEHGLTPETVREDAPIKIKNWSPENYNRKYFGPVTLTQGLALSLNTVSVRLTMEVGPKAVARTAYRLGIASKLNPNASLALGTSEVSLMELASAYAPFANGGVAIVPHVVQRVRTKKGKTLYVRATQSLGRIIAPRYVAMMNAMLRETLLIGTARKAELAGLPAAGKTGTSQDFRDGWFIGYTAHLVTGVWLGNDDSSPTKHVTGGGLPVEIWTQFMTDAHRGVPVAALPGLQGESPIAAAFVRDPDTPQDTGTADRERGLDGWLLNRLFGGR